MNAIDNLVWDNNPEGGSKRKTRRSPIKKQTRRKMNNKKVLSYSPLSSCKFIIIDFSEDTK